MEIKRNETPADIGGQTIEEASTRPRFPGARARICRGCELSFRCLSVHAPDASTNCRYQRHLILLVGTRQELLSLRFTFMPRVLLIGWDSADWKVIRPLIEAGLMPNLARLIGQGVSGNLGTIYPILSPMLWTSIATGKRPYKHGIHGFTEPMPDGSGVRPVSLLSRKVKAVWNILNQNGKRSLVVGWWPSHPAEPINGAMVSNHFQRPGGLPGALTPVAPGAVHPSSLADKLSGLRVHAMELEGE